MKILIISLAGIGDTILATPLIHEIRANFPEARLDALVLWAGSKDVLEGNPHLNEVYQRNLLKENRAESVRWLRQVGAARYDFSINTHPQSRIHYRLTAFMVGARVRISHLYECSGLMDRVFVNRVLPQEYTVHTVENNLAILPLLGGTRLLPEHRLELFVSAAEHAWAEEYLARHNLGGRQLLGIHAGSGGTKNLTLKRWPLHRYVELLKRLRDSMPQVTTLLFGGPDEEAEIQSMMAEVKSPHIVRADSRSLREAGALMKRCHAFLSVDTALMHVAAAVNAPNQIVIEAPTFNKTNEPYGNPFTLVRNPMVGGRNLDYYRYNGEGIQGTREHLIECMESVTVEAVFEAVGTRLACAMEAR